MRKENSKYVERDGPIAESGCETPKTKCDAAGGIWCYADQSCENCASAVQECEDNNLSSVQDCCNKYPRAAGCENCAQGGGSTEDCSTGAKISTSAGMVTCCDSGQSIAACASADGISQDLASELCGAFDDLSRACIAIPGGESARDRPDCVTQTISMPNGKGYSVGVDTYLNSSLNCNNAQDPEQCAVEGALQYFKACRKGSTGPPHRHHGGHHGGHKRKKKQPTPSPTPSPVTGQGSNKGGMSGGEIAGIVVGSVAGAILLLLAVGALLRGSGKKGKKK